MNVQPIAGIDVVSSTEKTDVECVIFPGLKATVTGLPAQEKGIVEPITSDG